MHVSDSRPIPDELWLPLKRRLQVLKVMAMVSSACMVFGACGFLLSIATTFDWMAMRIGAPLGFIGLATALYVEPRGKRALADLRQLMIEYHGSDPGVPR